MKFKYIIFFLTFFTGNFTIVNCAEFKGSFLQGSFILGKTQPQSKVIIDNKKVRVSNNGYFAFGLGRDRKNDIIIKITRNGNTKIIEKKVIKREYKIQKIDVLPFGFAAQTIFI